LGKVGGGQVQEVLGGVKDFEPMSDEKRAPLGQSNSNGINFQGQEKMRG